MKLKISFLFILLAGFLASAEAQQGAGIYPMKSGHIEYTLKGDLTGTKTVWFDDYGALYYERENSVMRFESEGEMAEEVSNRLSINTREYMWIVDMETKTGQRYDSYFSEDLYSDFDLTDDKIVKEELEKSIVEYGGEYLGMEMFLGRNCHVYTVWGTTTWLYHGIALKMITEFEGLKTEMIATLYEENIDVPATTFVVPEEVTIEEYVEPVIEEEDYSYADFTEMTWPYDDFEAKVRKLSVKGFEVTDVFDLMGMYSASLSDNNEKSIYIIAKHIDNFITDVDLEFDNSTKLEKYGCPMIYTPEIPYDDTNTSLLVMKDTEKSCYWVIYAYPVMTEKQMQKIAKQLK